MFGTRLPLALEAGLSLPDDLVVFNPTSTTDLSDVPAARVVQPLKPDHDHFARHRHSVAPEADGAATAAVICIPRAKREAQALIAQAVQMASGPVVIDGQKGDGVDSLLKAVRARVDISGVISKAHGKLFWFTTGDPKAFEDWRAGPTRTPGGFWTAPGVFSADGIDPGSALLADALPDDMHGVVCDLGAGWGFLSAHILVREAVERLHLVEAHHMALQCAEHNVTDLRAHFHWADAINWKTPEPLDAVVMNPPFHKGKTGDPGLGQAFIATAAKSLSPRGALWLVANRHLPYEDTLSTHFSEVLDLGGDQRFKLFRAERPKRRR